MATQHEIKATHRADEGKGASRRLRRTGQVPAVVYGAHKDAVSIQILHNTILLATQHEWFYSAILDLDIEGKKEKVLLRDLQRHPYKAQILHLDFQRVSADEKIHIKVPLHFLNQEKSPAGKISSVVITHEMNEVEITCLPKDLPEFIEVDLNDLKEGDTVHLSDIKLPPGLEIPELRLGREHDVAVVVARQSRAVLSEEGEEGEGDAAE